MGHMMKKQVLVGCSIFALAACGTSENEEEQKIDYAAFDDTAVEKLVDGGDFQAAIDILKGQEELGIADKQDFLVQAKIYGDRLDGVATEVAIEKAREKGATIPETALALSKALVTQGRYSDALQSLEELEQTPETAYEILLLQADIANAQEDYDKARGYFNQAVENRPDDMSGYLGLAVLELEQGNFEKADVHALEAAAYSDQDPIVDYVRGTVARYQRRLPDAISFLEKATGRNAGHVPALLELAGAYIENNEFQKARNQLEAAFKITPGNPMLKYYDGLIYAIEGRQAEAEEMLLKSEDLIKTYPPATRTYAHVAYRLGKCENAQPYFERFLGRVPNDKMTVLALADCYTRMGKPERALGAIKPILDVDPNDMDANLQAAGAAGLLRDLRQAKPILEKAFLLAAQNDNVDDATRKMIGRRLAHVLYSTGEADAAARNLMMLQEKYGVDAQSLILLSNIQMEIGDLATAEQTVLQLMKLEPGSVEALNAMGALRFRQRNLDEAIDYYDQAIAKSPRYQSALKNRALAYIGVGKFDAAEEDLLLLFREVPDDGELRGLMGRVYLEQQKPLEAMKQLKQAHQQSPKAVMIAADYALALARSGYVASAISQAEKTKGLIKNGGEKITAYLDGLIADWEQQDLERRQQSEAEKTRIQEEIKQKLDAKEKAEMEAKEKALKDKENDPDDETGTQ